jgi:hypothetical protein
MYLPVLVLVDAGDGGAVAAQMGNLRVFHGDSLKWVWTFAGTCP